MTMAVEQGFDVAKANANLISAAPAMLKALETITSCKRDDGNYDRHDMAGAIVYAERALLELKELC